MNQTGYPTKTRSAAIDETMPGRRRTSEVDKVSTTRAPMHGTEKSGRKLANKKGLPRGK